MIVLIPAYEPDTALVRLVAALRATRQVRGIVVVDDGSGPGSRPVLDDVAHLGAVVVGFPTNRGKGAALRRGLREVARRWPGEDVVCADADGQHAVADVLRVGERVSDGEGAVVLGARAFAGDVPLRSRVGNTMTRWLFRAATGLRVQDTQTGLRGYPATMITWLLAVRGDRYEYELNVLLAAARQGHSVVEVGIETIYLDDNASSHFRPLADSARIYAPLLAFSLSSLLAFGIDTAALLVLDAVTGSLLLAVVGARGVSGTVNFLVNRRVFGGGTGGGAGAGAVGGRAGSGSRARAHGPGGEGWAGRGHGPGSGRRAALRYAALAVGLLAAGYGVLRGLTGLGLALLPAKVVTEVLLFATSYEVQRRVVFRAAVPPGQPERGGLVADAGRPTAERKVPRARPRG
ncbi:glycosyltransferase family 2 protein [Oerskovia gallyi]|uniref:Glycosyltransferase family 2 protein n=1 Tax=Oerskovia gallyi TaxID=2762226 RepID=A0ABR8V4U7_9CELL|nr:glycosyltransferase family 2 protein [Oerskovia gallyi]MBD7999705.1 glycosyltransferase family 2 protein [Oerskovia gallyi]